MAKKRRKGRKHGKKLKKSRGRRKGHRKGKGRRKGRRRSRRMPKGLRNRKVIAHHKIGGKDFACYAKRVRAGRSRKKVLRMYCPNVAK